MNRNSLVLAAEALEALLSLMRVEERCGHLNLKATRQDARAQLSLRITNEAH